MTTRAELAALLNGSEYPLSLTNDVVVRAKAAGLVIVYGASDDLMEFEGAIRDEVGCYEGGEALVDAEGVLDRGQVDERDDDAIHAFVERRRKARCIEAFYDAEGYTFVYETDIPHDTFDVMEDGEKYCRGIVFSLSDL